MLFHSAVLSLCQDMSIAGKRSGIDGARSGLYFQAVRIIKEMLETTNREYPKYLVFENVPGMLSSNNGADFIKAMDIIQELGFIPDPEILDAQHMGVPQRRKRVYITWVQIDYILQKRTTLSDSIILQLLTEILLINLAELSRAYGVELPKSVQADASRSATGLRRRMHLFSLQKESRLQMLQMRLNEIKATLPKERESSVLCVGVDRTAETMLTPEGMKWSDLKTGKQFSFTGSLLRECLDDSSTIMKLSTTSIWTKEIIAEKIYMYFQALLNTLDATICYADNTRSAQISQSCFDWVRSALTELKEYTNARSKYRKSIKELAGNDLLEIFEQRIHACSELFERNLADGCGCEVLPQLKSLYRNPPQSGGEGKGTAGGAAVGTRTSGGTGSLDRKRRDVVFNDQGGSRMDVTEEVTCTLRAEAHHPPVVMDEAPKAAGFCTEHSAKARNIGYEEERSPTLRAGVVPAAIALENHPADSRIKIEDDGKVQTLSSRMGTGGNNVPLLMEENVPITMKIRSGCEGGGKGQICQIDKSATLGCNNDQTVFVPEYCDAEKQVAFGISSKDSNAMKSDNPHAGIYEASTSRTLDGNGGNPGCNQGGIAIVAFAQNQRDEVRDLGERSGALASQPGMKQQTYVLQGSMIGREDKNGPQGDGINEDVSFTLNTIDRHAVAVTNYSEVYAMATGSYMQVEKEKSPTQLSRDYKDPTAVNEPAYGIGRDTFNQGTNALFKPSFEEELQPTLVAKGPGAVVRPEPSYTVRRLTPVECARLQGFADDWCDGLESPNPTDEEVAFWMDVFETYRRVSGGNVKPKTEKAVRKWISNPYSDSAAYRLWGNGIALPSALFVMMGIVKAEVE